MRQNQRDTLWDGFTNLLGFPVMGVWRAGSDGTDINALCRSHALSEYRDVDPLAGEGQYVATAGDDGRIRLFAYPCVVEAAPDRACVGHSSHVMGVAFAPHNRWCVSAGGKDRAIFQWKVYPRDPTPAPKPLYQPEVFTYDAPRRVALLDALSEATIRLDMPGGAGGAAGAAPGDGDGKAKAEEERRKALVEALKKECEYEIKIVTSNIRCGGLACFSRRLSHSTPQTLPTILRV